MRVVFLFAIVFLLLQSLWLLLKLYFNQRLLNRVLACSCASRSHVLSLFLWLCAYLLDRLVCSNACMLCNQVSFILAVLKCFTYIQHCVFFVLVFFINLTFQGEKTCSLPGSKTNIFCWIFNKIFVSSLTVV